MPRVHGFDSDYQRRHRGPPGSSIFSLSTPFSSRPGGAGNGGAPSSSASAASSSSSSTSPQRRRRLENDIMNMDDDDMVFRGTQDYAPLAPPPDVAAASTASAAGNDDSNKDGAHKDAAAAATITTANDVDMPSAHGDGKGQNGNRKRFESMPADRQPTSLPDGNRGLAQKTDHQQQQDQFQDGMEEEDDSDATTMDDNSVDLLDDQSNEKNENKKCQSSNGRSAGLQRSNATAMTMMSPISPATQTLDRLSKFGSQEGGAELCIHLLADAAETHGKEDDGGRNNGNDGKDTEADGEASNKDKSNLIDGNKNKRSNHNDNQSSGQGLPRAKSLSTAAAAKHTQETHHDNRSSRHHMAKKDTGSANMDTTAFAKSIRSMYSSDPQKEQALQDLKQYFMSTKNSSDYAVKKQTSSSTEPPSALFCQKCKYDNPNVMLSQASTVSSLPHHGLCPHHPDFYNSGSYEILNLVVDGNILGCDACIYQFDHGRPNKKLPHNSGCKRGGGKKNGGANVNKQQVQAKPKKKQKQHQKSSSKQQQQQQSQSQKISSSSTSARQLSPTPSQRIRNAGTSTRPNISAAQLTPPPTMTGQARSATNGCQSSLGVGNKGPFEVGTVVFVEDRTWPGRNDPGGVARILKVYKSDKDETLYDVKYIVETRKEKGVEEEYVSLHSDYVSPTKDDQGGGSSSISACESDGSGSQESVPPANDSSTADIIEDATDNNAVNNESVTVGAKDDATAIDNRSANPDTAVTAISSPARTDEDGHPLSDYERKRLRNIQKNRARLAQLGLLDNPNKPGNRSNDNACKPNSKAKKAKSKQPSQDIERRILPKRRAATSTNQASEELDGKPDATVASTEVATEDNEKENKKANVSLAEAADTGCKKCDSELRGGERGAVWRHDANCPLKRKRSNKSKAGCKNDDHDANEHAEDDEDNSHCGDLQQDENLCKRDSSSQSKNSYEVPSAITLADAAKAGCRKCTLEWQTEEADPTTSHDICCPRVGKKKGPPPAVSETQSKRSRPCHSTAEQTRLPNSIPTSISPATRNNVSTKTAKKSNTISYRAHQPTPSPLLVRKSKHTRNPPHQVQPPPPMPAWIKEFLSESNCHNEAVPSVRGSKWLPCSNPWGKIGHEDGDFVIISPFQSESENDFLSVFHRGQDNRVPKRFVANPFGEGSPYLATHLSPATGGYSVLRVTRDRTCLRPWGFTVRLHEFGGACLVDGIEPLSPAEAAEDISGWVNKDSSSGLQLHDMIICVNGRSVGSMTLPELQIELDVSGPEMMLVVSRFDIQEVEDGARQLEDLAMDWNDIGAGASLKRKRVSFEGDENEDRDDGNPYELKGQPNDLEHHESEQLQSSGDSGGSQCDTAYDRRQLPSNPMPSNLSHKQVPAPNHTKKARKTSKQSKQTTAKSGCTKGNGQSTVNKEARSCDLNYSRKKQSEVPDKGNQKGKRWPVSESGNELHSDPPRMKTTSQASKAHEKATKSSKSNHSQSRRPKTVSRYQKELEELCEDPSELLPENSPKKIRKKINSKYSRNDLSDEETLLSSGTEEGEYDVENGDENPWLGCVCGKTHPHPIKVFWIQCEGCDAWYNVAEECVGFNSNAAEELDEWCCWACAPPVAGLGL